MTNTSKDIMDMTDDELDDELEPIILPKVNPEDVIENYQEFKPSDVLELRFHMIASPWAAPWGECVLTTPDNRYITRNIPAKLLPKLWPNVFSKEEQKLFKQARLSYGRNRKAVIQNTTKEYKERITKEKSHEDPQELNELIQFRLEEFEHYNSPYRQYREDTGHEIKPIRAITLLQNLGPAPDDFQAQNEKDKDLYRLLADKLGNQANNSSTLETALLKVLEQNAAILAEMAKKK